MAAGEFGGQTQSNLGCKSNAGRDGSIVVLPTHQAFATSSEPLTNPWLLIVSRTHLVLIVLKVVSSYLEGMPPKFLPS